MYEYSAESAALHEELSRTKELYVALSKDRDTQIEKLKEEHSSQISALKLSVLVISLLIIIPFYLHLMFLNFVFFVFHRMYSTRISTTVYD